MNISTNATTKNLERQYKSCQFQFQKLVRPESNTQTKPGLNAGVPELVK